MLQHATSAHLATRTTHEPSCRTLSRQPHTLTMMASSTSLPGNDLPFSRMSGSKLVSAHASSAPTFLPSFLSVALMFFYPTSWKTWISTKQNAHGPPMCSRLSLERFFFRQVVLPTCTAVTLSSYPALYGWPSGRCSQGSVETTSCSSLAGHCRYTSPPTIPEIVTC